MTALLPPEPPAEEPSSLSPAAQAEPADESAQERGLREALAPWNRVSADGLRSLMGIVLFVVSLVIFLQTLWVAYASLPALDGASLMAAAPADPALPPCTLALDPDACNAAAATPAAASDPNATWSFVGFRALLLFLALALGVGLVRLADRLTTPVRMVLQVDIERAKAASKAKPAPTEEDATEMVKVVLDRVLPRVK